MARLPECQLVNGVNMSQPSGRHGLYASFTGSNPLHTGDEGGELCLHCLCEISCDEDDDLLVSSHSEGTADFPICPDALFASDYIVIGCLNRCESILSFCLRFCLNIFIPQNCCV